MWSGDKGKNRDSLRKGRVERERRGNTRKRIIKGNVCLGSEEEEYIEQGRRENIL